MRLFGVVMVALLMSGCDSVEKAGYYKGYELPAYQVSERIDRIELRHYQPQLVAEVSVEGDRDDAVGKGFRILAGYIFGDNDGKQEVAMTSPVSQTSQKSNSEKIAMTTPVAQSPVAKSSQGKAWVVQFGMPKKYTLETLPKPKDSRIRFRTTEPKKVAVIQFAGRWNDALFEENKKQLDGFIKQRKLKPISEATFAYYDDPFTFPWNRRNEILIEVK